MIKGAVSLIGNSKDGFQPSTEHIGHIFEIILEKRKGLFKNSISLRIPITLKAAKTDYKEQESPSSWNNKSEEIETGKEKEEEEEDDEDSIMMLPLAKFKLEERYNLLSKTAQLLEEHF